MPTGRSKKATCDLCCDSLEKQQEILTCEGDCGCTVHRYCAGVTKRHYEELTKGSSPFVCQWCSIKTSHAIIQQLQSEVASLKSELVEAKATITKQCQALELVSQVEKKTYASTAAQQSGHSGQRPARGRPTRNSRRRHAQGSQQLPRTTAQQRGPTDGDFGASISSQTGVLPASSDQNKERSKRTPRVIVEGARRIWNTYVHATTKTIENAIARFCNVEGLRIKRKTRMNSHTGKTIWWFVVHGDESTLRELDSKWECLHTQASWVLQPCTKPAHEVGDSQTLPSNAELQSTTTDVANDDNILISNPPQDNPGPTSATPGGSHHAADHNNSPFLDVVEPANQPT